MNFELIFKYDDVLNRGGGGPEPAATINSDGGEVHDNLGDCRWPPPLYWWTSSHTVPAFLNEILPDANGRDVSGYRNRTS